MKSKNDCYLKEIKEQTLPSLFSGYNIDVPENWYSSLESHCILFHAPKDLKNKDVIYYANKLSVHKYSFIDKEIKLIIDEEVKRLRKVYGGIKVVISEFNHKKFGSSFILKYGHNWNGIQYTVSDIFIKNNLVIYKINYSSWNKYYDEYLPDVLKIIESFNITEDN